MRSGHRGSPESRTGEDLMHASTPDPLPPIVGISGASDVICDIRELQMPKKLGIETHLAMNKSSQPTVTHQTDRPSPE